MNDNYILMTANWCGPCKVLSLRIAKANITVKTVKMEEDPALFKKYNVRQVPVLLKLTDSEPVLITGSDDIFQELKNNQS
jgi:thiol-disulfide isomerase/thioredoxin